jgi:membrane protease YdiL (CAAX protease family)
VLATNGDVLAFSAFASAAAALGLVAVFVGLRRGATLRGYLALEPVKLRVVLLWVAVTAVGLTAWDLATALIERPVVPDFMAEAYGSSELLPLLWLAVILAAPLWEELVFRGFAYPGLRCSRYGAAGAIVLPTLIWAGLHAQYDLYDWSFVFLLGILLGWAREKTGTVTVPLLLHVLVNLVATVEVALL